MATVRRFEELDAWQTARQLVIAVHDLTEATPFARDFDLKSQIRRAAISAMSDIAEGFDSRTQAIFLDLLGRAKGSAAEVRAQLYIALDRGYVAQEQFDGPYDLADKTARQVYRLMEYLESQPNARRIRENRVEYNV